MTDHRELIGRVRDLRRSLIETFDFDKEAYSIEILDQAITALSAQDTVRNDALEEAVQALWPERLTQAIRIIRALKSPAAEKECEHEWGFGLDEDAEYCMRCRATRAAQPSPQKPEPSLVEEESLIMALHNYRGDRRVDIDPEVFGYLLHMFRLVDRRLKPEAR